MIYNELFELVYKIYIISAIVFTIIFIILKCNYNFDYFDKFLYSSNNDIIAYVLFHVILYMIVGIIFGLNNVWITILKTIIVEISISMLEKCDLRKINIEYTIYSISISVTSLLFGAVLHHMFL